MDSERGPQGKMPPSTAGDNKHDQIPSQPEDKGNTQLQTARDKPHTTFSRWQRVTILTTASCVGLISPISGSIYFPAVNEISTDLNASVTLVNLTVAIYMVSRV